MNKRPVDGGGQAASWTHCILDLVLGFVDLSPASNLYVRQHCNIFLKTDKTQVRPYFVFHYILCFTNSHYKQYTC